MARKIKAFALTPDTHSALVGDYILADNLVGSEINDVLIGYGGADTMTGGLGADTFVIAPSYVRTNDGWWFSPDQNGQRDTITDFSSAEGDKIDFSGLRRYVDTDGNGISEVYAVTSADIEVEVTADGSIVHVHQVAGDPTFDAGVVVIGAVPAESDFIFAV